MSNLLSEMFDTGGRLQSAVPGYIVRPGQIAMARRVLEAFEEDSVDMHEAGTGVGKSFAYLVPAAMYSLKFRLPVVVSTGTLALQQQIISKDIPLLKTAVPADMQFSAAVVKGWSNYFCHSKFYEAVEKGTLDEDDAEKVSKWVSSAKGDLEKENYPSSVIRTWETVAAESEACTRDSCTFFGSCPVMLAKRRASVANLLITNHAILALSTIVPELLPMRSGLVIDEGHKFPDMARGQFGAKLTERGVLRALTKALDSGMRVKTDGVKDTIRDTFDMLARGVPSGDGYMTLPGYDKNIVNVLNALLRKFKIIAVPFKDVEYGAGVKFAAKVAVNNVVEALESVLDTNRDPFELVAWAETSGERKTPVVEVGPVNIGNYVAPLFRDIGSVVTSATLSAGGDFRAIKKELGLPDAKCFEFPSPYDYERLAAVNVVTNLPEVEKSVWVGRVAESVVRLVAASKGRALVLCTSYAAVRTLGDALRNSKLLKGYTILQQGEDSVSELTQKFREDEDSILVGTASFWEGFDAPGNALRHVVITKLPFAVPSHPLERARHAKVERSGGKPFFEISLPDAIAKFKQGFGRLVRAETDWGLVTVLDSRLITKGYGGSFIRALPEGILMAEGTVDEACTNVEVWFSRHEGR